MIIMIVSLTSTFFFYSTSFSDFSEFRLSVFEGFPSSINGILQSLMCMQGDRIIREGGFSEISLMAFMGHLLLLLSSAHLATMIIMNVILSNIENLKYYTGYSLASCEYLEVGSVHTKIFSWLCHLNIRLI